METIILIITIILFIIFIIRMIKVIYYPNYRIIQRKRYSFIGERVEYYVEKTDIIGWHLIHNIGHDTIDDAKIGLDHYLKNKKSKSIIVFKK